VRRTKTERSSALNLDRRSRSPFRFSDWILHRRGQGVTSVFHRGVKGAGAVAPDEPARVSCHIVSGEEASHHPEQLFAVGYAACSEGALGVVARRERLKAGDASTDSRISLLPTEERRFCACRRAPRNPAADTGSSPRLSRHRRRSTPWPSRCAVIHDGRRIASTTGIRTILTPVLPFLNPLEFAAKVDDRRTNRNWPHGGAENGVCLQFYESPVREPNAWTLATGGGRWPTRPIPEEAQDFWDPDSHFQQGNQRKRRRRLARRKSAHRRGHALHPAQGARSHSPMGSFGLSLL
jgi:hypothetical protein